ATECCDYSTGHDKYAQVIGVVLLWEGVWILPETVRAAWIYDHLAGSRNQCFHLSGYVVCDTVNAEQSQIKETQKYDLVELTQYQRQDAGRHYKTSELEDLAGRRAIEVKSRLELPVEQVAECHEQCPIQQQAIH